MRAFVFVIAALVAAPTGPASSLQDPAPSRLACSLVATLSDTSSGSVGLFAVGTRGRIAWTEGRVPAVQLRDAAGNVRSAGRAGGGPGEFVLLSSIGWLGDTLWVSDSRAARIQFFSDTGTYLTGVQTSPRIGWAPRANGRFVGFAPGLIRPSDTPYAVLSLSGDIASTDTVHLFPRLEPPPVMVPVRDREIPNPHPLVQRTIVASSPGGARYCAVLPSGERSVRVECVDDRGNVVLDHVPDLIPRSLTDAVYDSVVQRFSASPGRTPAMMRDRISRPSHLPVVLDLRVEDDGAIWLGRSSAFEPQARWARLDPEGRAMAGVTFPANHRLLAVHGDSVWVAIANADDIETIAGCLVTPD